MSDSALNRVAAQLYLLPPEQFIPAREERAQKTNDAELAERIHQLKKPTTAAWALNNLAAEHGAELDKALELGTQLEQAQEQLDGSALLKLSEQRRQALHALAASAQQLASRYGHPLNSAVVQQVRMTLNAALSDSELAEELRSGTLVNAAEQSGFGPGFGLSPSAGPTRGIARAKQQKKGTKNQQNTSRQQELAQAREAVNDAAAQLKAAKFAIREKEKTHRQIDQKRDALQVQLDKLTNQGHKIAKQLAELRAKADRANNTLTQARQQLAEMRKSPKS